MSCHHGHSGSSSHIKIIYSFLGLSVFIFRQGNLICVPQIGFPHCQGFSAGIKCWHQGLSQDLETGCPKLAIVKFLGVQIFKGDHNILRNQPLRCINFIKIRHNICIQCHGNHMDLKKFNYMLEIDILRNSPQRFLGVLRGAFLRFGCTKRHPDALLAKTMVGTVYR